jgi:predicted  nucleic acid-binding Zn-ribbon protein
MIKKALVTVGGLTLLSVLFFGADAASYARTTFGWMKDSVKSTVPIEFEIERARQMVKNLVPDIRKNMHVIAQEEVEIERLDKQIVKTNTTMEKERAEIMRLKNDLSVVQPVYNYAGREFTHKMVQTDLANRFERYKTHDATLGSLREIQAARRKSLEAARQKLEGMLQARRDLEVQVENLEVQFKRLEVAQTTSAFNIDDSQLGRVKELIGEVRNRLTVAERLAQSECFEGEIPLSGTQTENIVDQVTEYFNGDQKAASTPEAQASTAH